MERDDKKRLLSRTPTPAQEHSSKKQRTQTTSPPRRHSQRPSRAGIPGRIDLYSFTVPDRSSPNPPRGKSKEGHFRFENGDNIGSRYKILSLMGEGTFGRVLECWDRKRKVTVAIKVIRSVPKYRDAAMIELEVLNTITQNDRDNSHCCIHLQHWFDYQGHVCIVFEKLGSSLFDFMRRNGYRPFPLDIVQHFARQLLRAIDFLHSLHITHTDLKPENILLMNSVDYTKLDRERYSQLGCRVPLNPDIRVIDFGSATFEEDRHSSIVSTRHYRAPEVILGLGWSFQCDLWSAGCILVELITGRALFQTHENLEHLAMIERVVHPIPCDMVKRATKDAQRYFHAQRHTLLWEASASRKSFKAVQQLAPLKRLLKLEADASVMPHLDHLHSLLADMLSLSPMRRSTARRCLSHDFFRENIRSLLPKPAAERSSAPDSVAGATSAAVERAVAWDDDVQIVAVRGSDAAAACAATAAPTQAAARGATDAQLAVEASKPSTEAANDGNADGRLRGQGGAAVAKAATAAAPDGSSKARRGSSRLAQPTNGKAEASAAAPVATRTSARVASRQRARREDAAAETSIAAPAAATQLFPSKQQGTSKGMVLRSELVEEDAPPSDVAENLPWGHACGTSA